jgi:hypothetical protein
MTRGGGVVGMKERGKIHQRVRRGGDNIGNVVGHGR